jgi:hypothetical protein
MDIIAGHFGYLAYHPGSKLSFPFIEEIIGIARAAVKKGRGPSQVQPAAVVGQDGFRSEILDENQETISDEARLLLRV